MGTVVDERLQGEGRRAGLRVVDASVMPGGAVGQHQRRGHRRRREGSGSDPGGCMKKVAIVTGGTSGIGEATAEGARAARLEVAAIAEGKAHPRGSSPSGRRGAGCRLPTRGEAGAATSGAASTRWSTMLEPRKMVPLRRPRRAERRGLRAHLPHERGGAVPDGARLRRGAEGGCRGAIVNVSSVASVLAAPARRSPYAASKAALADV